MDGLLDQGRHLCTDNWYTSVPLARNLIKRKTHLFGTIRKNRRGLPWKVISQKLKRGMVYLQQSKEGITVLKWRDKHDILMLSTMHDGTRSENDKPKVVNDYNQIKLFVDTSDQMASYSPFVRKTTKWYIRLFFHLITQTAMVNAWRLYNDNIKRIKLVDFKIEVVESLLESERSYTPTTCHKLEETKGAKVTTRRRCVGCYKFLSKSEGQVYAANHAKKVNTRCTKCYNHFCLKCFQSTHKKCDI